MFEKFKDVLSKISNIGKIEYVVNAKALEGYLNSELQFSIENELEACVNCDIMFKGEKHSIVIWNFMASDIKSEKEKGISITFDKQEYDTIENLLNNAVVANTKLADIKEYFIINLNDIDSKFLMDFKEQHPELNVEDYR